MKLKELGFPKYTFFIPNKPARARWAYHTGICPGPHYKQRKGDVLSLVSYVSPYNLPGYSQADMMEPIRHYPGEWRLGMYAAWLLEPDRMWGLSLALMFLIWVFPSSTATPALGLPLLVTWLRHCFLAAVWKTLKPLLFHWPKHF